MDRKAIIGFILIIGAIFFFQSKIYYEKILHKPHPSTVWEQKQKEQKRKLDSLEAAAKAVKPDTAQKSPAAPPAIVAPKKALPPAVPAVKAGKPYVVESPLYVAKIDPLGARLVSWKMKGYKSVAGSDTITDTELIPQNSSGALNLRFGGVNYDSLPFVPASADSGNLQWTINANDSLTLRFVCRTGQGEIEKEFRFRGSDWRTGLVLRKRGLGVSKMELGWLGGIRSVDSVAAQVAGQSSGPGGYAGFVLWGDEVEQADDFNNNVREYTGQIRWVCIKDGYFGSILILPQSRDAAVEFKQDMKEKNVVQMRYVLGEDFESDTLAYEFFAGPMQHSLLKTYGLELDRTIFQGYSWFLRADIWFPVLCGFVLWLLNFFYRLVPDYGLAIILLTIVSRVIMIPLTNKSQKSMAAMKDLQPKMNDIRARYKGEPQKMNAELMKLYKKHGINPMGAGCLPMVLQMPIFISLFIALRKAVELRGADTFLPWISDLSQPDILFHLPFKLPFYGTGVALLPIMMAAFTFVQNKMPIKDPNQKAMIYFMPIFLLFLFNSFPAGLNLYWTLSTALGIVQQWFIERKRSVAVVPQKA